MKRYISMLLCAAVLTASVSGCASDEVRNDAPAAGGESKVESTVISATTAENTTNSSVVVTSPAQPPQTVTTATEVSEDSSVSAEVATTAKGTQAPAEESTEQPEEVTMEAEYIPLTENDVVMTLPTEELTTDTEKFTVQFEYVGEHRGEYCFGCEYTLKKWSDEGEWVDFPLGENAAFNSLGYIIGSDSPRNSITVSLADDFYAQPVTAGTYLLVKPFCDGMVLEQTFVVKSVADDLVVESESGTLTLVIDEITDYGFLCSLPWPYPAVYEVPYDTASCDAFCVGDKIEVEYKPMYKLESFRFRLEPVQVSMSDFQLQEGVDYKPVIYLYPEQPAEVNVQLLYNGTLTVSEPPYNNGWEVTANPDGRIVAADGSEYPYLFWEGEKAYQLDKSEGFCVSGSDTEAFLREKLSLLGLNSSEMADFLEFWLPYMQGNAYNVIRFHGEDYTDNAVMDINPLPDTVIRVYMSFEPSEQPVEIAPQSLEPAPARSGFTVVEWGGSIG